METLILTLLSGYQVIWTFLTTDGLTFWPIWNASVSMLVLGSNKGIHRSIVLQQQSMWQNVWQRLPLQCISFTDCVGHCHTAEDEVGVEEDGTSCPPFLPTSAFVLPVWQKWKIRLQINGTKVPHKNYTYMILGYSKTRRQDKLSMINSSCGSTNENFAPTVPVGITSRTLARLALDARMKLFYFHKQGWPPIHIQETTFKETHSRTVAGKGIKWFKNSRINSLI